MIITDTSQLQEPLPRNLTSVGPFETHALLLFDNGLDPIPTNGKAAFQKDWTQFEYIRDTSQFTKDQLPELWRDDTIVSREVIKDWVKEHAGCNIGVRCGKIVAVDVDMDGANLFGIITAQLPRTPVAKRGQKGFTLFYRNDGTVKNGKWMPPEKDKPSGKDKPEKGAKPVIEILSYGNQTVVPPSIHPDTGQPYQYGHRHGLTPWGDRSRSLEDIHVDDLPFVSQSQLDELERVLADCGYIRPPSQPTAPIEPRKPGEQQVKDEDRSYWANVAAKTLTRGAAELARMGPGDGRYSHKLNAIAYDLGRFVPDGLIDVETVRSNLMGAMETNGWIGSKGTAKKAMKQIDKALRDGAAKLSIGERSNPFKGVPLSPGPPMPDGTEIEDNPKQALHDITSTQDMLDRLVYIVERDFVADLKSKLFWSAAAVKKALAHLKYQEDGKRPIPLFNLWMEHPRKTTVDTITWDPNAKPICVPRHADNKTAFNLWSGLPAFIETTDGVELFLDHVAFLVSNETERNTFLDWLAHIVQKPGELSTYGYLMFTPVQGVGRNTLMDILDKVLGRYSGKADLERLIEGNFNSEMSQRLLAYIDEVHEGPGLKKYKIENSLKQMITETERQIKQKYGGEWFEVNCCRWIFLTNYETAFHIDQHDRRLVVIENPKEKRTPENYARLRRVMRSQGFIDAVRTYLERRDISKFDPFTTPPMNEAKSRMIDSGRTQLDDLMLQFKDDYKGDYCLNSQLMGYVKRHYGNETLPTAVAVGHAATRAGIIYSRPAKIGSRKERVRIVDNRIDAATLATLPGPTIEAHVKASYAELWYPPPPPVPPKQ